MTACIVPIGYNQLGVGYTAQISPKFEAQTFYCTESAYISPANCYAKLCLYFQFYKVGSVTRTNFLAFLKSKYDFPSNPQTQLRAYSTWSISNSVYIVYIHCAGLVGSTTEWFGSYSYTLFVGKSCFLKHLSTGK